MTADGGPEDTGTGPLALVGSGEYLAEMAPLEASLLRGRPSRYVQLATAAVPDGEQVVRKWERMGREQAERLGVEAVTVQVRTRRDADDAGLARAVQGAGLVYMSGGHPAYLAQTLRGTAVWQAIVEAWQAGAALAGCSAGAMVMARHVPAVRSAAGGGVPGLALLPHVQVVPHFDAFTRRMPDLVDRLLGGIRQGVALVGVDELTAIVGGPEHWRVEGAGSAWLLGPDRRLAFRAGSSLSTPVGGSGARVPHAGGM